MTPEFEPAGPKHRVFKQNVDLLEGETVQFPKDSTPLTVTKKSPTEVELWFLQKVEQ